MIIVLNVPWAIGVIELLSVSNKEFIQIPFESVKNIMDYLLLRLSA